MPGLDDYGRQHEELRQLIGAIPAEEDLIKVEGVDPSGFILGRTQEELEAPFREILESVGLRINEFGEPERIRDETKADFLRLCGGVIPLGIGDKGSTIDAAIPAR